MSFSDPDIFGVHSDECKRRSKRRHAHNWAILTSQRTCFCAGAADGVAGFLFLCVSVCTTVGVAVLGLLPPLERAATNSSSVMMATPLAAASEVFLSPTPLPQMRMSVAFDTLADPGTVAPAASACDFAVARDI